MEFPDVHLETAIREVLVQPTGELIVADLLLLKHLDASSRGIVDLSGIEQLKNLEVLKLADNQVQDISDLTAMARLCTLELARNKIESIAPLATLSQLRYLDLRGNAISNLGPLFGLRALTHVDVSGNPLDENSASTLVEVLREKGIAVVFEIQPLQEEPGIGSWVGVRIVFSLGTDKSDLWMIPGDGSERWLLSQEPYGVYDLCWSPEGERIGFILAKAIFFTIALEGTHKTKLLETSLGGFSLLSGPSWSPDGQRILLEVLKARTGQRDIITISSDGSDVQDLMDDSLMEVFGPRWSPDGRRILFYTNIDPGSFSESGDYEILVMPTDGRDLVNLTTSPAQETQGTWSPDGTRIAFARGEGFESGICVMDADGNNVRRLTNGLGIDTSPLWSPDGGRIAFVQWKPSFETSNILVVEPDGGLPLNLTDHESRNTNPQWSPDGSKVLFLSDRDGNQDIYMVDVDGSDLVNVTQDTIDVSTFAVAPK
jgi:Tol biopolymer transport system component